MFFTRTNTMFEYEGLPETIPKEDLELIKQTFGSVTIAKDKDKIYAFYGGLGGLLNEYYHPTLSIVTNPYLKLAESFEIDNEGNPLTLIDIIGNRSIICFHNL
mgnify:CR=1 FL=1